MTDDLVEKIARAIYSRNQVDCDFSDAYQAIRARCLNDARSCLAEIEAAGRVIVPVEPTEAMLAAGEEEDFYNSEGRPQTENAKGIWSAMLSASRKG